MGSPIDLCILQASFERSFKGRQNQRFLRYHRQQNVWYHLGTFLSQGQTILVDNNN